MKHAVLVLLSLGTALLFAAPHSNAATPAGIAVSPAIQQITLTENQTTAHFDAKVTNDTGALITIKLAAQDFTTLDQNGGLRFLNPSEESMNNPHGLATAFRFVSQTVPISAGQTVTVPISIIGADSLAPGGHYAAVVYSIVAGENPVGNNVTARAAVSTLVFLSTYGRGTQEVQLSTPILGNAVGSLPDHISMVFGNTGNTQTTVRGVVQVTSFNGRLVSQGMINVDSGLILPGAKRLFNVSLASQKVALYWPGVYHLAVYYRYDGQADYSTYTNSFLYLNLPLISLMLALAVVIGYLVWRTCRILATRSSKR